MKNRILSLILFIVLLAGALYFFRSTPMTKNTSDTMPKPSITNAEMLMSAGDYEVMTEEVNYFPEAKGLLAMPKKTGSYPGVVMIHENRGLRPEIRETAKQLASEGYVVLAVDLYKGKVLETQDQARAMSGSFDQETGTANLKAAVAYLKEKGATKIASLGWCFGGRQSVALAISGEPLDATIVYYGGNMASSVDQLRPINWPVLGVFGDKDQAIPVEKVKEFESSLNTLGVENEIYIYPGVGHAFANPSGQNYAPKETKDAWGKTLNFLNKHLKSS